MLYPLVQEIVWQDPIKLFAIFAAEEGALLLDSAQLRKGCGRNSFIAVAPYMLVQSKNGELQVDGRLVADNNPFDFLAKHLARFSLDTISALPPFQGGVAGYFGYGLYQHLEQLKIDNHDQVKFPDLVLGFYDLVIGFDHDVKRAWIFSSGYPETIQQSAHAKARLAWLLTRIENVPELSLIPVLPHQIVSNFSATTYQAAVSKVIDYILAGDIFEANLSQCFSTRLHPDLQPFDLYRRLRELNPAPFAAYFHVADVMIASASPERYLQLRDNKVEARPIKGTRARSADAVLDQQFAQELLHSEKDRAENIMIVDLLRNDLSRVCLDHSVKVLQLCALESYTSVHHLVSVIVGELAENIHAIDLLRATFPGGSITGAPKIRAMEIINEIEPTQRGPYCGSIGYIGFNGDMDSSITIRTFAIKGDQVTFQAGGAIVADSDPALEYQETLTKAKSLIQALTE